MKLFKNLLLALLLSINTAQAGYLQFGQKCETNSKEYNKYVSLASKLCMLGKYQECLDNTHSAIKLEPNYTEAYHIKASALFMQNKNQESIETYEKIHTIDPDDAKAYAIKSYVLKSINKDKEASVAISKALLIDPENGEYIVNDQIFRVKGEN